MTGELGITADAAELTSDHPHILSASTHAYDTVAAARKYNASNVHRMRICFWISVPLCADLVENKGYDFWLIERRLPSQWRQTEHVYLRSGETSRGLIVVDGTWQQFVPLRNRSPALPKVAVGTPDEVVSLAQAAGVPDQKLDYWREPPHDTRVEETDLRFSFGLHD